MKKPIQTVKRKLMIERVSHLFNRTETSRRSKTGPGLPLYSLMGKN